MRRGIAFALTKGGWRKYMRNFFLLLEEIWVAAAFAEAGISLKPRRPAESRKEGRRSSRKQEAP